MEAKRTDNTENSLTNGIKARLTDIPEDEVLRYLGCRHGQIPPDLLADLRRCRQIILDTAQPRSVWRMFRLLADGSPEGTAFRPRGRDIGELLKDCHHVILFGVTLGMETERLLRRAQVQNMADAMILDCCASAAVENVCDNLCSDLQQQTGGFLTDRYSPGYGDLPFEQQEEFCRVLDLPRRIGVTLSSAGIMIPQKSVTALAGVSDTPKKHRIQDCSNCSQAENCIYRKEMRTCGQ